MTTKGFVLILAAAFLMPLNAEAQLGSKLKQKLSEKMSQAFGKEDTAGEADTLQGEKAAGQEEGRQFDLSKLGIGKVTAKYDETYNFRGMMQMKTEIYEKGKPEGVMDAEIWFNPDKGNMGMESRTVTDDEGQTIQATILVDAVNKVMITISVMEGGKTGMIMPIPDSLAVEGEGAKQEKDVTIRKTGETKNICGYRCDEYVITENDKMVSKVWATDELKFHDSQKLFGNQKGMPRNYGGNSIKGVMMASETYEKGSLVSRSEMTKVDLNASHTISTAGVSLIQMEMKR